MPDRGDYRSGWGKYRPFNDTAHLTFFKTFFQPFYCLTFSQISLAWFHYTAQWRACLYPENNERRNIAWSDKNSARGEQYLEPVLKEKVLIDARKIKRAVVAEPILSRREIEVLQFIASNLTSQQTADKLFVSKRTIDNHRQNLMMKLDVKNGAALIKKAIQLCLIKWSSHFHKLPHQRAPFACYRDIVHPGWQCAHIHFSLH